VIRRVRQAPDAWLLIEKAGTVGQQWQSAPEPELKRTKGKMPEIPAKVGDWRDLNETEFDRIIEDLKSGFWRRAIQEVQLDGTWVSVKAI